MIEYVKGDCTKPQGEAGAIRVIAHVCNDEGGWGPKNDSVASSISSRWKEPEEEYRQQFGKDLPGLKLGEVQLVQVGDKLWVANMVAQHGYRRPGNLQPLKYDALDTCLSFLAKFFTDPPYTSFHLPRIGTRLGGADWHTVEHLIQRTLCLAGYSVKVYDL